MVKNQIQQLRFLKAIDPKLAKKFEDPVNQIEKSTHVKKQTNRREK